MHYFKNRLTVNQIKYCHLRPKPYTQYEKPIPNRRWIIYSTIVGASFGTGLIYYFSRPESERRFIRVTLGGITRFIR